MYAVIQTGGKQYKVSEGTLVHVERLNAEVGDKITFHEVLFMREGTKSQMGPPFVDGASVKGTILEHLRDSKIIVLKFKRRKMYRRKSGHRQSLTLVRVDEIEAPAEVSSASPGKEETPSGDDLKKGKSTKDTSTQAKSPQATSSQAKSTKAKATDSRSRKVKDKE